MDLKEMDFSKADEAEFCPYCEERLLFNREKLNPVEKTEIFFLECQECEDTCIPFVFHG